MIFNSQNYSNAVTRLVCEPRGVFTPFVHVDRKRYDAIREKSSPLDMTHLSQRLGAQMLSRIRGAMGFTLRNARSFFPTYKFFIDEFLNDEWLASVDWHKGFHRDHVIHQPMAVYVGMSLLCGYELSSPHRHSFEPNGNSLLSDCVKVVLTSSRCEYIRDYLQDMGASDVYSDITPLRTILWESIFMDTFFLAALFHDIGYPWRLVNSIHEKLNNHSLTENPAIQNSDWLLEKYGKRLAFYPLYGYDKPDKRAPVYWTEELLATIREGLAKTHGVPGAVALLHLNDLIRVYPDMEDRSARRFCLEWAAMAVMMHDLSGLYGKVEDGKLIINRPHLRISFNCDPLSFMLTLTDVIEDFGRPDATFQNVDEYSARASYYSRCKEVKLDWDPNSRTLKIIYVYDNRGDYVKNRAEFLPKNELLYFHPDQGYLDFTDTGISQIKLEAELA
jgi:hypothetical protein